MNSESILLRASAPNRHLLGVEVADDPFPHVVIHGAAPGVSAAIMAASFPPWDRFSPLDMEENAAHRISASESLGSWIGYQAQDFVRYHTSKEWVRDVASVLPSLQWLTDLQAGVRYMGKNQLDLDCQFVINTPTSGGTTVRDPHVDNPREAFAGLWYFRHPDDRSEGGDLVLYDADEVAYHRSKWGKGSVAEKYLRPAKTIPCRDNTFVLFENGPRAIHGVTPRSASKFPRSYINIIGEVEQPLFSLG